MSEFPSFIRLSPFWNHKINNNKDIEKWTNWYVFMLCAYRKLKAICFALVRIQNVGDIMKSKNWWKTLNHDVCGTIKPNPLTVPYACYLEQRSYSSNQVSTCNWLQTYLLFFLGKSLAFISQGFYVWALPMTDDWFWTVGCELKRWGTVLGHGG